MAIVLKTVEYSFDTRTTTLALTTRHDFSSQTLTIEENTSRVFKSVILEVTYRSQAITFQTQTAWLLGIKLGAVAFSDTTVTSTISAGTEHQTMKLISDNLSSYFNSNFGSGTTQTCQVGVLFTNIATINITAKLIITYEFDDSSQTLRTKTVRIPLESPTALLTNTLTEIGTNQVPILTGGSDPFLPENSVTVKDLWFEFEALEAATATTDFNLALSLDAESEVQDGSHEEALNTSCWYKYIWRRTDMSTTSAHAFKARTTVTSRMSLATITLFVTYTYNHTNSTKTVNSIIIPVHIPTNYVGTLYYSFSEKFTIAEPGSIVLKQSGVLLRFGSANTIKLRFGDQTGTSTYSPSTGSTAVGWCVLQARLDSGSRHGLGITLGVGNNNFVKGAINTTNDLTVYEISGFATINYHSGIFSQGVDKHNHTTYWLELGSTAVSTNFGPTGPTVVPTISGTKYWISAVGHMFGRNGAVSFGGGVLPNTFIIGDINNFIPVYLDRIPTNTNSEYVEYWANSTSYWNNRPDVPHFVTTSGFVGSTVGRYWNHSLSSATTSKHIQSILTYHTMPYTVSGTITGYTGDGSGIIVEVKDPDGLITVSGTSVAGGYYTVSVYDGRPGYVAIANQDSTHLGRSDNITPTQP